MNAIQIKMSTLSHRVVKRLFKMKTIRATVHAVYKRITNDTFVRMCIRVCMYAYVRACMDVGVLKR